MKTQALLAGVAAATVALAGWALTIGDYPIGLAAALRAAIGAGPPTDVLVIQEWRLPRVLAALLAGTALASSGALLQTLIGNPLAAPDVVGVTMGSATAAVAVIVLGAPAALITAGAFTGGLGAAILLVLLARHGALGTERLVLVGIGLHTALYALKTFLIVRFPDDLVQAAVRWMIGSLYGHGWLEVRIAAALIAALLPVGVVLVRHLRVLELGADLAAGLGMRVRAARLAVLTVAVGLAATATALTGPVHFLALAVPFAVRAATGPLTPLNLLLTGAAGGLLLLAADVVAQHALVTAVPVGVITASIGAPFFFWLLWRRNRTPKGTR